MPTLTHTVGNSQRWFGHLRTAFEHLKKGEVWGYGLKNKKKTWKIAQRYKLHAALMSYVPIRNPDLQTLFAT